MICWHQEIWQSAPSPSFSHKSRTSNPTLSSANVPTATRLNLPMHEWNGGAFSSSACLSAKACSRFGGSSVSSRWNRPEDPPSIRVPWADAVRCAGQTCCVVLDLHWYEILTRLLFLSSLLLVWPFSVHDWIKGIPIDPFYHLCKTLTSIISFTTGFDFRYRHSICQSNSKMKMS